MHKIGLSHGTRYNVLPFYYHGWKCDGGTDGRNQLPLFYERAALFYVMKPIFESNFIFSTPTGPIFFLGNRLFISWRKYPELLYIGMMYTVSEFDPIVDASSVAATSLSDPPPPPPPGHSPLPPRRGRTVPSAPPPLFSHFFRPHYILVRHYCMHARKGGKRCCQ